MRLKNAISDFYIVLKCALKMWEMLFQRHFLGEHASAPPRNVSSQ